MIACDPRHGSRAGYVAGCHDACCGDANYLTRKADSLRRLTEGPLTVDAAPVIERLGWWRDRGVATGAVARAAGLGEGTLAELVAGERDLCLRTTMTGVLAVTWDTLPDRARCYADLTRARIRSLMAAGHSLTWIASEVDGLPVSGRWRGQEHVYVSTARGVMAVYRTAPLSGPSVITKSKARNAGHLHPLAWDDPEVPALPPAEVAALTRGTVRPLRCTGADGNVIDRILGGDFTTPATRAERVEVCRRWVESGRALNELARGTGWRTASYYRFKDVA